MIIVFRKTFVIEKYTYIKVIKAACCSWTLLQFRTKCWNLTATSSFPPCLARFSSLGSRMTFCTLWSLFFLPSSLSWIGLLYSLWNWLYLMTLWKIVSDLSVLFHPHIILYATCSFMCHENAIFYRFLGLTKPPKKNSESLELGDSAGFQVSDFSSWMPSLAGMLTNPHPCM